jgi:putative DNA primase/helicase
MYEAIPNELKKLPQWVCWLAEPDESRPGKVRKIPINARTGGGAMSNNPETWSDFATAARAARKYSGIGFMFASGYFGVDLDNCADAIADYLGGGGDSIAAEFINALGSYSEYSVSGRGIHIICRGALPPGGRRRGNVEMYESGRFFIMTGNAASEYSEIADGTERIKPLHAKYLGGENAAQVSLPASQTSLTAAEIVRLASKSKQGVFFDALNRGEWQGYYSSQSEADLAFCNMLAFWTGRDAALMDEIFRSSGLMRDKWERLGEQTIQKAIRDCRNVYEPRSEYAVSFARPRPAAPAPRVKLYSFDDMGNAERFIDKCGRNVMFNHVTGRWYVYDGRRWTVDNTGAVDRMLDTVVENIKKERQAYMDTLPANGLTPDVEKAFDKHAKSCRAHRSKAAALNESKHRSFVLPEELDAHKDLFNCANGTIDLTTGELRPFDRADKLTRISAVEYTDHADCPRWLAFLNEILGGDEDLIRYMQKAIGYSLTGNTSEDCVFFLHGTGRNGKSTLIGIIDAIMSDYAETIQPETLTITGAMRSSTADLADLKGARFVVTHEPNEGWALNEGLIKQMSGGDKMKAARKYENPVTFTPEYKLWALTNHKPIIRGTDVGIWSRVRLIPFTVRIPDDRIDEELPQKLARELPGILKWAVDGCLLWRREGLKPPRSVALATEAYKSEMDTLSAFLSDCADVGAGRTATKDLYAAYCNWARDNHEKEMTGRKFAMKASERFEKQRSNGQEYYKGITLKSDPTPYQVEIGSA